MSASASAKIHTSRIIAAIAIMSFSIVCYSASVFYPTYIALIIIIIIPTLALVFLKRKTRTVGLLQGVALQMAAVVPVAIAQLTGFVWKSWSISPAEAIEVFPLSVLFDMAGWSVVTPFEWLVPKRQTWVFSNLGEFGVLWISKVMLVAMLLAWRREKYVRKPDWLTIVILLAVFADSWASRDFPWWGT
jgi:hypothetical protein